MAVGRDSHGFFMLKGIVGDSAKDGFFVMYTLFGRKRGDFHGGRRVCDSIFFTETEFYCMVEVGKRDCGGLQRREWME